MFKDDLFYLASPYSHPDSETRESRFKTACEYAAFLMRQGIFVFSPIAHTHPIAIAGGLPTGWDFWHHYGRIMLRSCTRLLILKDDGWQKSIGIQDEIRIMLELGKPIHFANFGDLPNQWELYQ